jgi:hypothetical protein
MRDNYRFILYAVIFLVILIGVLLFGFRDALLNYAQTQSGLTVALSPVAAVVPANEALDTSILQNPNFTALVNHVVNFNFDNICWRPDTVSQAVASVSVVGTDASTTATTTETNVPVTCIQGNSLPFVVKTK